MAITTFDQQVDAKFNRSNPFISQLTETIIPNVVGFYSLWTTRIFNGAIPIAGSGNTCSSATTGAVPLPTPAGANTIYTDASGVAATVPLTTFIVDRLVTTSGLDGTLTSAQAVNSVALPARATGGVGCSLIIEAYVATGATPVTFTVSYTNSSGISGRTATVTGTLNQIGKILIVPLQSGDVGIQSVQSVTQSVTTGGAGNYGITIYKTLTWINCGSGAGSSSANSVYDTPIGIVNTAACLWLYCQQTTTTTVSAIQVGVGLIDGLLVIWTLKR
jgi:hypothetical protein